MESSRQEIEFTMFFEFLGAVLFQMKFSGGLFREICLMALSFIAIGLAAGVGFVLLFELDPGTD